MDNFNLNPKNHQVQYLLTGKHTFFIHGSDTRFLKDVLEKDGIQVDSLTPCAVNPNNGIFKVWIVGELIDYIKEKGI